MSNLLARLQARIQERTDFANDQLEAVIEKHDQNSFALAMSASSFDAACVAAGVNPDEASNAVLGLAEQFGESFPTITEDRKAKIKSLVRELVPGGDNALETITEDLFDKAFDWETSINDQNRLVNEILAQVPPQE
jgi:hypothetical protein